MKRNTKKEKKKMNKKYPYKVGGKNRTKKITLLLFVMLSMVLLVGTVSAINWDNKEKYNDTSSLTLEKYGKYEIYNSFILGIGYGNKLIDLTLEKNTESCADNCEAIQDIILYEDGSLVDDIRFYSVINGIKTNDLTSIRNYEIFIGINEKTILEDKVDYISCQDIYYKNGTIGACYEKVVSKESVKYYDWVEYELGTEMPVGHYKIKLQGEKKWNKAVDWEIKSQGIWTEKWATWGSALTTAQESHGESMVTYSGGNSLKGGVRIFVTHGSDITLFNMTKPVGEESTKCYVAYLNKTIIATADFVGNDCDIADTTLKTGEFYWLFGDKGGAVYDNKYDGSVSYNISGTYIDWTKGQAASDGNEHDMVWAIESVGVGVLVIGRGAVSLNTPANNDILNSTNVVFNCSANQTGATLINITRQDNSTGTWTDNQTIDVTGTANSTEFTQSLGNGVYLWSCSACDSDGDCGYATENRTVTVNTTLNVQLISPTNETTITTRDQNFTVNYTSTGFNITNVTYFVWYSNSTIFNQTTVNTNQAVANQTILLISNFTIGDYLWNVEACGTNARGVSCQWGENNYTFIMSGEFSDYMFNSPIVETSLQTFYVLLETPEGTTIQAGSGKLNYNGTDYSSITATDLGSNQFNLSKTIYIPSGISGFSSENRSFFWNITVVDITTGSTFIQTSDTYNQNVTELKFGLCSSVLTTPMLNFTLYDETLGTQINSTANAVTFQTTFKIGGHWSFMNKTVSVNNLSVDASEFDFCTNNPTNVFYTDMESFYEAVGFTGKNYYLTNATLTNTTNEINLYLLNESAAIEFFVTVEQDLSPIKSAQVTIQKYFVGEGVYKTVEIDETSSDTGEFTAYFDLDKDYKFVITKDGSVLGTVTKTASCKEAPCEMTLSLSSAVYDYYSVWGDEFASNVLYNLSYNPNTKIVTFDFIDTTGLANYFRMQTYEGKFNQSSTLIFDTTTYSSSGTITANLTAYDKGNFIVYTYVSRSPEIFIDYLKIFISNLAGTFGILGLFCAFLLVITIIFGLSHSPPTLILAVPLSLTIAVSIGILSISWGGVVLVWILAIISMWAVSR